MTIDTVSRRLDRLERENRLLKRTGVMALIAVAALTLMGQAAVRQVPKVIEAQRFVVRDASGNIRAIFGAGENSLYQSKPPYGIVLYDESGTARAWMETVGGLSQLVLQDDQLNAGVSMGAIDGKVEFELNAPLPVTTSLHPGASFVGRAQELREKFEGKRLEAALDKLPLGKIPSANAWVHGRVHLSAGRGMSSLAVGKYPWADNIELSSSDDRATLTVKHSADAHLSLRSKAAAVELSGPSLWMFDENAVQRLVFGISDPPAKAPFVALFDEEAHPRTALSLDAHGLPAFHFYDKEGKEVATPPQASASGSWILWRQFFALRGDKILALALAAWPSRDECEVAQRAESERTKTGGPAMTHVCLPDTLSLRDRQ